jgi:hypothetical protein
MWARMPCKVDLTPIQFTSKLMGNGVILMIAASYNADTTLPISMNAKASNR